jgi:SAM-dependent methyltransferase
VTAGDISEDALAVAQQRFTHEHLEFIRVDCKKLDFDSNAFDAYTSFETIEHFTEQDDYLMEAGRVLKPEGVFICSTPNKEIHELYRRKGWMGPNPYHVKELTVCEFRDLLESHFSSVELYGQDFELTALKLMEVNRTISEIAWEIKRLPLTLLKSLVPIWIRKVLSPTKKNAYTARYRPTQEFSLGMVKISKLNVDNADTVIAVCRGVKRKHVATDTDGGELRY